MEEYPRTLAELDRQLATEQACVEYLYRLRWPKGFVCPRCKTTKGWLTSRGLCKCAGCSYQVSAKAGTIFEKSRLPLTMWFRAIWWVTSQKNGASAKGLQRFLGLGSYETAWAWLHKLRRAMVRPDRDQLFGDVEANETYLGEEAPDIKGRRVINRAIVVIAVAMTEATIGRIRLRHVPNVNATSLQGFVVDTVKPGSLILFENDLPDIYE